MFRAQTTMVTPIHQSERWEVFFGATKHHDHAQMEHNKNHHPLEQSYFDFYHHVNWGVNRNTTNSDNGDCNLRTNSVGISLVSTLDSHHLSEQTGKPSTHQMKFFDVNQNCTLPPKFLTFSKIRQHPTSSTNNVLSKNLKQSISG